MKNYLILLLLCSSMQLFSQIEFEKGYFVNNSGQKINCLIKNEDWEFNPVQFQYKTSENSEVKNGSLETVSEFEVGQFHFVKFRTKIDKSSESVSNMSSERAPEFVTEMLFLRLILDGESDLYQYSRNSLNRFYYKKTGDEIQPLIYKKYLVNGGVKENKRYQQQLSTELRCEGFEPNIRNVDYKQNDLVNFFSNYNRCLQSDFSIQIEEDEKGIFQISPKFGIGAGTFKFNQGLSARGESLKGTEYRIGSEFEYRFPFSRNKWAVLMEPTFRKFNSEKHLSEWYETDLLIDYTALDFFVGLRHYLYVSSKSRIFINAGIETGFVTNSKIEFSNTGQNMDPYLDEFDINFGIGLGLGYSYNNKFNIQLRYNNYGVTGYKFVDANYEFDLDANLKSVNLSFSYSIL